MPNPNKPQQQPVIDRLEQGENVTAAELLQLHNTMPQKTAAERQRIDAALDAYETSNAAALQTSKESTRALSDLRRAIMDENLKTGSTERALRDAGITAGRALEDTAENAQKIGYQQWKELTRPDNTMSNKILGGLGVLALGYGVYRIAKWVKGTPQQSFLWKLFKFTGVAAAAGFAINTLGKNIDDVNKPKQAPPAVPPVPPVQPPANPNVNNNPKNALNTLPQNVNIADGKERTVSVEGKDHTIAFTQDAFVLDGKEYAITALNVVPVIGGNKRLSISNVTVNNGMMSLTAGALGKSGTLEANEDDLISIMKDLANGKTVSKITNDGINIEIAAS